MWRVVSFPFRLIFNILAFPFRLIARFLRYLNAEPEEHPLTDVLTGLVTDQAMRTFVWAEIDALRKHLLRSIIALAITVAIASAFTRQISVILAVPLAGTALQTIEVTETVSVFMRIALLAGIALALPYIAFELWLFAAPGLKPRERKIGLFGIPFAALLFLGGMAFTYFILPAAIGALQEFNDFMGFASSWRPNSYFSFVTGLMFWIGVAFEFPLVIYILTAIGFVKPTLLAQQWRLAIVIIAVMSAAITPTVDPVNMALVMLPMTLLYFISIGLSFIAYAGRRRLKTSAIPEEGI
jgi:sec-independent protein translocase protein TatC